MIFTTILSTWIVREDIYQIIAAVLGAITAVVSVFIAEHLKKRTEHHVLVRPVLSRHTFKSHLYFEDADSKVPLYKANLSDDFKGIDVKFVNVGDAIYNVRYVLKLNDAFKLTEFLEKNDGDDIFDKQEFKLISASLEHEYDYIGNDQYIELDAKSIMLVIENLLSSQQKEPYTSNVYIESEGYESYIARNKIYSVNISKGYYLLIQLLIDRVMKLKNQSIYSNFLKLEIKYEDITGKEYEKSYIYSLNITNTLFNPGVKFIRTSIVLDPKL
ncbi:hypothetical protein [Weissella cibaria]|uniref:hypothetical protein n=1 Tax=Weissella cibaria TaxID=137591 RepID=UPI0022E4A629|nr:hypothetical protein [Weissella cibaria]